MNAQKVYDLRQSLWFEIAVMSDENDSKEIMLNMVEDLCRQIELARKEPMPCKVCGKQPNVYDDHVACNNHENCFSGIITETLEQWDKEQMK